MEDKNLFYFRVKFYLSETEADWREGLICAVDISHASSIIEEIYGNDLILVDELSPLEMEIGGVLIF